MSQTKIFAKVTILILLYYICYAFYYGLTNPIPALGDSWDYHIPISQSILNGTFISADNFKLAQWYYPGSAEAINSLFILLQIPLTLSNLFASIILFLTLWKLGTTFRLPYYTALLFAASFCSLHVVVRWFNAVSIDVWAAVFFCLAVILLEHMQKTSLYFLKLGFVLGMLIGTKYTALLFAALLCVVYGRKLIGFLSVKHIVIFLIPFSIFGLFWLIRNYIIMGNPFYPMQFFGLPTTNLFTYYIYTAFLEHPVAMFHAFFSEYKLWMFILFLPFGYLLWRIIKKKAIPVYGFEKLLLIGGISSIFFLFFPTSEQEWIMVSSLRYSYPVFIPLILATFILANKYNRIEILGYFAVSNILVVTSFAYYPKLILFYFPLAILSFYFIDKYAKRGNIIH